MQYDWQSIYAKKEKKIVRHNTAVNFGQNSIGICMARNGWINR